jgi:hypothetical protein
MPTPMHVFDEIAFRYLPELDLSDDAAVEKAVDTFWEEIIPSLPKEEQQGIFDELLDRDCEAMPDGWKPRPRKYTTGAPLPKIDDLELL